MSFVKIALFQRVLLCLARIQNADVLRMRWREHVLLTNFVNNNNILASKDAKQRFACGLTSFARDRVPERQSFSLLGMSFRNRRCSDLGVNIASYPRCTFRDVTLEYKRAFVPHRRRISEVCVSKIMKMR